MPGWRIREASNGETALRLVETDTFDIIFMVSAVCRNVACLDLALTKIGFDSDRPAQDQ